MEFVSTKSKCIIIGRRAFASRISIIDAARNLGMVVNNRITWVHPINVVGQTYKKIRCLWSTQYFMPIPIDEMIAKAYLMPSLMYGCKFFDSCDSTFSKICLRIE